MKREKLMDAIKDFPQEFELEDLIEKLIFVEKIEKGLAQVKEGKIVAHEKVKEIAGKW
jgi:predicted transcriptional regulator